MSLHQFAEIRYVVVNLDSLKEILLLKPTIQNIFPIALAIILPGLSLFAKVKVGYLGGLGFYFAWGFSSLILYSIWYLIWYLWDIRSNRQNWWVILLILCVISFLFGAVQYLPHQDLNNTWLTSILRMTLSVILILAFQYSIRSQANIARLRLEKEQMQTENFRVQLSAIRAKVDPHFLFNSLNTLRSMVRQGHEKSEDFILSLSQFYRQTLKYDVDTAIRLSEELEVLESYLFVMKSRNEEAVQISIDIGNEYRKKRLPTLALQVIVENCFKHNSVTSKNPLRIDIIEEKDSYISIRNNKQPKLTEVEASGYGLNFLRKRYELMNVEDGLMIEETSTHYIAKLKLLDV